MNYESHTWPAHRFYWALLDADASAITNLQRPATRAYLDELFAPGIPIAMETAHIAYAQTASGIVGCAVAREDLANVPSHWLSLTPASLPEFLSHLEVDLSQLNLLVREFEPQVLQASQSKRTLITCAAMVICTALIGIGWLRQVHAASEAAIASDHAVIDATSRVLSKNFATAADAESSLQTSLQRARSVSIYSSNAATFDASAAFAAILEHWPSGPSISVQNISITGDAVTLNVDVQGDPQPFLKQLAVPQGWKSDEPRLSKSGETTRVVMVLHPSPRPPARGGT